MDGVKISLGSRLAHTCGNRIMAHKQDAAVEKAIEKMDLSTRRSMAEGNHKRLTSGEDWENADIWEKIKIAWDKISFVFSAWGTVPAAWSQKRQPR